MIIDICDAETNHGPDPSEEMGTWVVVHFDHTTPDVEARPLDSPGRARIRPLLVKTVDIASGLTVATHFETL